MELSQDAISRAVRTALEEDLGAGDVTSEATVPAEAVASGRFTARAAGVIAGLPVAAEVFRQVSPSVRFAARVEDGAWVEPGRCVAEARGPARALLAGERVALNFLQRLSGVATLTRRCVEAVRGHEVKILDTRKTTPGLRLLEKYAVRMGGGTNHRIGLYDQVLIKDNHLAHLLSEAGTPAAAVRLAVARARARSPEGMLIEVETETLEMVDAAIEADADIIMLDNMTLDQMREAARRVRARRRATGAARPVTEASGGIRPEKLAEVAATGVDSISLGALTHSAPALDIALDFA
jgi:nicotinate-nucleotide pyrophosphorylase (carboxylating)